MKFVVLALDYDGTVTLDDTLDPGVRAAIAEVRRKGILVVLVTGRRCADLHAVMGDFGFLDAVVAENGCVLTFPREERTIALATPPPPEFGAALARAGVRVRVGDCLMETDAANAAMVLKTIRALELPLVLLFNRDRLMILPQGVSKATGLHAALRLMRLSEHNAIAIGDAENDHALLQACEVGVAVEWGSPALRETADDIVRGAGPRAVASYIRTAAERRRLPQDRTTRRQLVLGQTDDGQRVALAVRGRNALIVGDSGSGKSWFAGMLTEQHILQRYSLCVVDPEGDHRALEKLPGVVTLGGAEAPPRLEEVTLALRHPDLSLVLDLSKVAYAEKQEYVAQLLLQLGALRRRTGLPHRVVLDEAHHFLQRTDAHTLLDTTLEGYTFVTYRLADLNPVVRASCAAIIALRLSSPEDVAVLWELNGRIGQQDDWRKIFGELDEREAILLPLTEEAGGELLRFRVEPRITSHVRHRGKYLDVAVPDHAAFVFTSDGQPTGQRARTMRELVALVRDVTPGVLQDHLARGDLSRWIEDVFADEVLARRIRMLEGSAPYEALSDLRSAFARVIEERYVLAHELV